MLSDHFQRVADGANAAYSLSNLSSWITKNTKLEGRNYSFKDHEYQKDIIDDDTKTLYVSKCAQSGLSEIFARWGMAACATQKNFTLIWTFPTTTDAERFCKARLDPFLDESKAFQASLSRAVNSTELKKFGSNSFAYIRGTISDTGALSVPADLLIHDEFDRSDMGNIAAYVSRLQHKPTKMRRIFSTPTVEKYGISKAAETTRRHRQMWTCSHCNHAFLPNYEENGVIPGWDKTKKEITKANIKDIAWTKAKLLCPHCGREPSTDLQYREWVVENNDEMYDAKTIFVAPFCLPNVLTPSYLVKVSTEFDKWSEFVNQALGLTAEDSQDSITVSDVESAFIQADLKSGDLHYFGADMGVICHITIARLVEGKLVVAHREKVNFTKFETRRAELIREYKCITSVHDMYPYTDIIQRITGYDSNAFGAIFVDMKNTATHRTKEEDEDPEEGRINMRQVQINRNIALDELMNKLKAGEVIIKDQGDKEEYTLQLRDMKRVQQFNKKDGGMHYVWVKTQGYDHWHHSLLYAYIASKLRGTYAGATQVATSLVTTVRIKSLSNRRPAGRIW